MNCDAAPLTDKQKDELIELRFQQLNEARERIRKLEKEKHWIENTTINYWTHEQEVTELMYRMKKIDNELKALPKIFISKIDSWCNENKIDNYNASNDPNKLNWVVSCDELSKFLNELLKEFNSFKFKGIKEV